MFYCMACAEKNDYPETLFKSRGPCELCGSVAPCNDLPTRRLNEYDRRANEEKRRAHLPVAKVIPINKQTGLQ